MSKTIKMSEFLKTGIYFLIKSGRVVYIGKTERFPIRFGTHILVKDFDSFRFIEYPSKKCHRAELRLINYFKPKYNIISPRKIKGDFLVYRSA